MARGIDHIRPKNDYASSLLLSWSEPFLLKLGFYAQQHRLLWIYQKQKSYKQSHIIYKSFKIDGFQIHHHHLSHCLLFEQDFYSLHALTRANFSSFL